MIFRHPVMFHPPPNAEGESKLSGETSYKKIPPKLKEISSSSSNGRWDQMVLNARSLTGIPHTAVFEDVWKGWDITIRTKDQMISGNTALLWTKTYTAILQINIPPPD